MLSIRQKQESDRLALVHEMDSKRLQSEQPLSNRLLDSRMATESRFLPLEKSVRQTEMELVKMKLGGKMVQNEVEAEQGNKADRR
jgi:hypothetical protein